MTSKAPYADCDSCPLRSQPFVPTYVPEGYDGTLVVGEGPGFDEAQAGVPFVGVSGRQLARTYTRAGGDWEAVARTNTVLCRPPGNRTPTAEEMRCCAQRLRYDLNRLTPKKLVAVGTPARQQLSAVGPCVVTEGVWNENTIGVVHPAFVLRQPASMPRFRRAIERVVQGPGGGDFDGALTRPPDVIVIRAYEQLCEVLESIADQSWVAYDLETNQTRWYTRMFGSGEQARADMILCMAFTTGVGYGWIVHWSLLYDDPRAATLLNAFFRRVRTVTHNGKFDLQFLRSIGIRSHIDFDTMVAAYTLDEEGLRALKPLVAAEFGVPDYEAQLITRYLRSQNDFYSKIPEAPLYQYAVWDVCATMALALKFKKELIRQKLWERPFQSLMMPGFRMLANVEFRGVRVDIPYLQLWKGRFERRAEFLRAQIAQYATGKPDFNPGSVPQMKWLLFTKLGLPLTQPVPKSSGRGMTELGSTDKDALKQLKGMHPVIDLIGEYRTCRKMLRTYIVGMLTYADENGRVHTSYSNTRTQTGRLASSGPALQNIPKGRTLYGQIIRAAFIPSDGCVFVDADYAQAELRVFAAETNDPFLVKVYENDEDLHEQVVIAQWGPIEQMSDMEYENRRFIAKIFNFGWAYGGGASMLVNVVPDPAAAQRFVTQYEANMPVAAAWRRQQARLVQQQGYVQARTGRRRRNLSGNLKPTEAINSPIQGGASDCTVEAGIRLDNEDKAIVLLVHDQLVVEVPVAAAEAEAEYIVQVMAEEAHRIYPEVPWKADYKIKTRWAKELTDEEAQQWITSAVDVNATEEDTDDGDE